MKGAFYLQYALRALRRGGQRTALAILCVAFGVMSLVSMHILSTIIGNTVLLNPTMVLGGEAQVSRPGQFLSADDVTELEHLQAQGHIEAFTLFERHEGQALKRDDSGRVYFVARTLGIDPATYPLTGKIALRRPDGITLPDALKSPGSAAITRDLSRRLDLKIGDTFTLNNDLGGVPTRLHVTAIVQSIPDQRGDTVLYNQQTARMLAGRPDALTDALLLLGSGDDALAGLEASGWRVRTPEQTSQNNKRMRDTFDFMLKGAGILGLLVGGIGIANTMQVLLARRTLEIATLKTLGYGQRDLMALFGLETALLGVAGSALGAGAAIAFAHPLVASFERIGSMLLEWSVSPLILMGGMLVGTLTALIFGLYAILQASAVRPAMLLRALPVARTWRGRFQALGLGLALAVPFGLLSSSIMGSLSRGVAIVGVAVAGLVGLGLLLGAALFLLVRLPLSRPRLLVLARNNLKRQGLRTIFALIALFTGVFAVGFAVMMVRSAQDQFDRFTEADEGYNLFVFATQASQEQIAEQFERQPTQELHARYRVPLQVAQVYLAEGEEPHPLTLHELEGRAGSDLSWDLELEGEPWGTLPDGAYLPARLKNTYDALEPGSTLRVTTSQGQQRDLKLAGFYSSKETSPLVDRTQGVLVREKLALELGGAETSATFIAQVPVERLQDAATALGQALPQAVVVSAADVNDFFQRALKDLFVFAVTVAGLALVAGAVLIANAVGLAMVERRREMGILKAVGFSSGDVL
ncbi:MAG: FtsX-like permease family protein, partial [Anaerolineae bacterium]